MYRHNSIHTKATPIGMGNLPNHLCLRQSTFRCVICGILLVNCLKFEFLFVSIFIGFTYIKSREVSDRVNLPPKAIGCSCKGICTNPNTCECAKLNGSDFPYVRRNGGR